MCDWIIHGKRYTQEQLKEKIAKEKAEDMYILEKNIVKMYSSYHEVKEITKQEFRDNMKHASSMSDLCYEFSLKEDSELYERFKNYDGIICNSETQSNPACEYYYWDIIFKYKGYYYMASAADSN